MGQLCVFLHSYLLDLPVARGTSPGSFSWYWLRRKLAVPPRPGGRAGKIISENWYRQVSVHMEMGHKSHWDRQGCLQLFSPFALSTPDFLDEGACPSHHWDTPHQNPGFRTPSGHSSPSLRWMPLSPPQHPLSPIMPHPTATTGTCSIIHLLCTMGRGMWSALATSGLLQRSKEL